jgi:hypothetical protein
MVRVAVAGASWPVAAAPEQPARTIASIVRNPIDTFTH